MTGAGAGADSRAPVVPMGPPVDRPAIAREQAEAIYEEVARLPRAFRLPVVLCYFEGLTVEEAARRLRRPAGTIRSRLARARAKVQGGLTRRGVVLPAAALTALLAPRSATAPVPPILCDSTTRAALAFAAVLADGGAMSAPAAALAHEVLKTELIHKLKLVVMTVTALAATATAAGYLAHSMVMREDPMREPTASAGSASMRRAPRRPGIPPSTPWPAAPAPAPPSAR